MQFGFDFFPPLNAEPLGDMTLAPFAMTKRTESDLARAMAEHVRSTHPGSGAEGAERAASRVSGLAADLAGDGSCGVDAALVSRARDLIRQPVSLFGITRSYIPR